MERDAQRTSRYGIIDVRLRYLLWKLLLPTVGQVVDRNWAFHSANNVDIVALSQLYTVPAAQFCLLLIPPGRGYLTEEKVSLFSRLVTWI
jgi:hypothetical protein